MLTKFDYTSKTFKVLFFAIPIGIIVAIISFFLIMNSMINHAQSSLDNKEVAMTYIQSIDKAAYDKKHAPKKTPQQVAQQIMLKSVGLGGSSYGYDSTGIASSDGLFVKQGVINGNAVPYSSNFDAFNNIEGGVNVKSFDQADRDYWSKVKENDFNKMKNNAQKQVDDFRNNNAQFQEQEMENQVRKAQYDARKDGKMQQDDNASNNGKTINNGLGTAGNTGTGTVAKTK